MNKLFTFDMKDFELVRVNGKSIILRSKVSNEEIYVSSRIFNRINADPDNLCRIVNVEATFTPKGTFPSHLWLETFSRF